MPRAGDYEPGTCVVTNEPSIYLARGRIRPLQRISKRKGAAGNKPAARPNGHAIPAVPPALRRAIASAPGGTRRYLKYGITCLPHSFIESMIFWCGIS
jgi:hypothetical protein